MAPILVIGHLTTSTAEAREKIINALSQIMEYAKAKEPGVTKYCITVPQDTEDATSVFVIEEYADQAAFDSHMAPTVLAPILDIFQSEPGLLKSPPAVQTLEPVHGFTRAEIKDVDPFIIIGNLTYKNGTIPQALEGWKSVATATENNETGTFVYSVAKDKVDPAVLVTVEVYQDERYLWDVHAPSDAVQSNKEKHGGIRTGLQHTKLRRVAGYLHKVLS
ncbi:hypothetical protein M501DRAFT_937871 [Patellaria atrata CBS 101060]|uniref:ABM domain-containing protein n=1 Tax=Patellaria atrata CBS 101060 TaxID=1346257 RepID=A0A9P4S797_9PEZI|nr:hypothetical protein M501DRAFT_937871 [Patellaria atrata CBS 101060]